MDCSSSSSSGDDEEAVVAAARRQIARRSEALLAGLPDKPEVGEIQACTGCGHKADSTMAAWFGAPGPIHLIVDDGLEHQAS